MKLQFFSLIPTSKLVTANLTHYVSNAHSNITWQNKTCPRKEIKDCHPIKLLTVNSLPELLVKQTSLIRYRTVVEDKRVAMFFILFLCMALAHAQQLNVTTTEGSVIGAWNGSYFSFFGLRYGGSTSGVNRFKVNISILCLN